VLDDDEFGDAHRAAITLRQPARLPTHQLADPPRAIIYTQFLRDYGPFPLSGDTNTVCSTTMNSVTRIELRSLYGNLPDFRLINSVRDAFYGAHTLNLTTNKGTKENGGCPLSCYGLSPRANQSPRGSPRNQSGTIRPLRLGEVSSPASPPFPSPLAPPLPAYCSNHGLCDPDLGACKCFTVRSKEYQWISSNGYGESGPRGDCGHMVSRPPVR
jgi:hypothetical protein